MFPAIPDAAGRVILGASLLPFLYFAGRDFVLAGYSVYQALCVLMVLAGAITLALRRKGFDGHTPASAPA